MRRNVAAGLRRHRRHRVLTRTTGIAAARDDSCRTRQEARRRFRRTSGDTANAHRSTNEPTDLAQPSAAHFCQVSIGPRSGDVRFRWLGFFGSLHRPRPMIVDIARSSDGRRSPPQISHVAQRRAERREMRIRPARPTCELHGGFAVLSPPLARARDDLSQGCGRDD